MNTQHRILIVDDHPINRQVLSVLFETEYEVFEADSGESALRAVQDFSPDIVLLDIMMPEMDGLEVCRRLREDGGLSFLKILLVSARTGLIDRLAGYRAGADDYVTKPFEDEELTAKVRVFSRLIDEEQRRREAESALRDSEVKFKAIFSAASDGFILLNQDGIAVDGNDRALTLFGLSRDALIGSSIFSFSADWQADHGVSYEEADKVFRSILNGQSHSLQWRHRREDGASIDFESSAGRIEISGNPYVLLIVRDVSERADWENRLEAINREMQTLWETGAMVASVAHDAKKFTTAMALALEGLVIPRLSEKLDQSVDWVMDLMNDIIEIHANANQCNAFLESLLAINEKNEEIGPVSCVDLVKQAISLLSYNLMQEGIHWRVEADSGRKWMVMGNSQLIQVFMNLIANAADTLRKHQVRIPEVSIRIEDDGEDFVRVSVADNGPGIQPAVLETIRKGIDTASGVRGGGGFGISGASQIIKVCNGRMMVESEPGQGATFMVLLPKALDEETIEIDLDGIELF
jgi:PAS domain S-box-containing protein